MSIGEIYKHIITQLLVLVSFSVFILYDTGSPKKHETWKTTWGFLIDLLIRIIGP